MSEFESHIVTIDIVCQNCGNVSSFTFPCYGTPYIRTSLCKNCALLSRAKLTAAEKLAERVKRYTITPGDDGFDLCEFVTAFEKAEENLKTELSEIAFATHATNIFNLRKEGER